MHIGAVGMKCKANGVLLPLRRAQWAPVDFRMGKGLSMDFSPMQTDRCSITFVLVFQ